MELPGSHNNGVLKLDQIFKELNKLFILMPISNQIHDLPDSRRCPSLSPSLLFF